MAVLVACEESQAVTIEFRKLGIEAYSCDILPCSGGHPEWHLQQDVLPLLKQSWDMILAFPPCTHLASSGARWFKEKQKSGAQDSGVEFFMEFVRTDCEKMCIENPVGIMSNIYRKPDQIVQPYYFGDEYQKRTCLWLRGLPKLKPTKIVGKGEMVTLNNGKKMPKWYWDTFRRNHSIMRSKTPSGLAKAMAEQFGRYVSKDSYV